MYLINWITGIDKFTGLKFSSSQAVKDYLIKLYVDGISLRGILEQHNYFVAVNTLRTMLQGEEITMRQRGGSKQFNRRQS